MIHSYLTAFVQRRQQVVQYLVCLVLTLYCHLYLTLPVCVDTGVCQKVLAVSQRRHRIVLRLRLHTACPGRDVLAPSLPLS